MRMSVGVGRLSGTPLAGWQAQGALACVPNEMVTQLQAIGTPEMVRQWFEKYQAVGITCLGVQLDTVPTGRPRIGLLEQVTDIVRSQG